MDVIIRVVLFWGYKIQSIEFIDIKSLAVLPARTAKGVLVSTRRTDVQTDAPTHGRTHGQVNDGDQFADGSALMYLIEPFLQLCDFVD